VLGSQGRRVESNVVFGHIQRQPFQHDFFTRRTTIVRCPIPIVPPRTRASTTILAHGSVWRTIVLAITITIAAPVMSTGRTRSWSIMAAITVVSEGHRRTTSTWIVVVLEAIVLSSRIVPLLPIAIAACQSSNLNPTRRSVWYWSAANIFRDVMLASDHYGSSFGSYSRIPCGGVRCL